MARSRQKGFTLIELLVVIAIIAIGAAIAVPSIISYMPNFRLRAASSELLIAFKQVRGEAVKRGQACAISFNQAVDGQVFDYVLFVDNSTPPNLVLDADDEILDRVRFAERSPGIELGNITFAANAAGIRAVGYTPRGLSRNPAGGFGAGRVEIRTANGSRVREIVMTDIGGTRIGDL
jgi:type IV fimbrial biogenesis protein FimT